IFSAGTTSALSITLMCFIGSPGFSLRSRLACWRGAAPRLGVVVLDHGRRGDRLGPLGGPAALELALLDVLVHALLFVGHLRQVCLLWHSASPCLWLADRDFDAVLLCCVP